MKCFVCDVIAQIWDRAEGGKSVDCTECGRYDISAGALADRDKNIRVFDVQMTRIYLNDERTAGNIPPLIERHTARWH
jgi:hypothetical protein